MLDLSLDYQVLSQKNMFKTSKNIAGQLYFISY